MLFILKIDEYSYLKMSYSRRRMYQYNEDDFDFNFDLYQVVNQHRYSKTWKQREAVN